MPEAVDQLRIPRLAGRVALVTGAGRNIGRAIALAFAREAADVVINARRNRVEAEAVARAAREHGVRALPVLADVSSRPEVDAMVRAALEEFGHVDILVNCAGSARPLRPFLEISEAEWRSILGVILDGAFYCAQAVLPSMLASGGGNIINVSGPSAFKGQADRAHVIVGKAGILGLTRALAIEFGSRGVRVNTIVPDWIQTERPPGQVREADHAAHRTALGRRGLPEDVADVCVFLASDESRFITGQTIHINGGTLLSA